MSSDMSKAVLLHPCMKVFLKMFRNDDINGKQHREEILGSDGIDFFLISVMKYGVLSHLQLEKHIK